MSASTRRNARSIARTAHRVFCAELQAPPLGLYVHIPWCIRKCPYCDFNSHVSAEPLPETKYVDALTADLEEQLPLLAGREIRSIFIGGGTPSLFAAETIAALLTAIRARAPCAPAVEITLEANPGSAERGRFEGYRQAGVTRLSLGVQSFNNRELRALGRIHDASGAIRAADAAGSAGFANINLDLMFGLPQQPIDEALADIETALRLEPAHISHYQLTVEPGTLFHKHPPRLPADENLWEMQLACRAMLREHGFERYEISAFARPDRQCRHNLNYWQYGDYLGIGAGAHGKISDVGTQRIMRTAKVKSPTRYLQAAGTRESFAEKTLVPPANVPLEFLMNALRLKQGFATALFAARTGLELGVLEPALSDCIEDGLLEEEAAAIRCSARGLDFLDEILRRFL